MARPELAGHANELAKALQEVGATTKAAWATDDPQWQVWVALLAWMLLLAVVLSILVKRSRDELVDWL